MRAGKFKEGEHVLRAKIDLAFAEYVMDMRDPLLYRDSLCARTTAPHRKQVEVHIPTIYDYAHPLSDAMEKITHSICTVEFEAHRPLYHDWFIREAGMFPSQQIEFRQAPPTYTLMSKRKLIELVQSRKVSGWDDPRMATLAGMRAGAALRPRAFACSAKRSAWPRPTARGRPRAVRILPARCVISTAAARA